MRCGIHFSVTCRKTLSTKNESHSMYLKMSDHLAEKLFRQRLLLPQVQYLIRYVFFLQMTSIPSENGHFLSPPGHPPPPPQQPPTAIIHSPTLPTSIEVPTAQQPPQPLLASGGPPPITIVNNNNHHIHKTIPKNSHKVENNARPTVEVYPT